jgi:hypothetical protein
MTSSPTHKNARVMTKRTTNGAKRAPIAAITIRTTSVEKTRTNTSAVICERSPGVDLGWNSQATYLATVSRPQARPGKLDHDVLPTDGGALLHPLGDGVAPGPLDGPYRPRPEAVPRGFLLPGGGLHGGGVQSSVGGTGGGGGGGGLASVQLPAALAYSARLTGS